MRTYKTGLIFEEHDLQDNALDNEQKPPTEHMEVMFTSVFNRIAHDKNIKLVQIQGCADDISLFQSQG